MKVNLLLPTFILSNFFFLGCESTNANKQNNYQVNLLPKNESKANGVLQIAVDNKNRIHLTGKIAGLNANSLHGFHIHEVGDCSDSFAMNAGGHFNPDAHHQHGNSILKGQYKHQHAGDLGNLQANASGIANIDLYIEKPLNLQEDDKYSILGKSIVVHADEDDEKTSPAGNAGKRILCGVIK